MDIMRIMKKAGMKKVKFVIESVIPFDLDNTIEAEMGSEFDSVNSVLGEIYAQKNLKEANEQI
jgi:hypothetical protein